MSCGTVVCSTILSELRVFVYPLKLNHVSTENVNFCDVMCSHSYSCVHIVTHVPPNFETVVSCFAFLVTVGKSSDFYYQTCVGIWTCISSMASGLTE